VSALLSAGDASPRLWVGAERVGEVGEELSAPGAGSPAGAADGEAGTVSPEPVTRLRLRGAAAPQSDSTIDARFALPKRARASVQPETQTVLPRVPPANVPVRPRTVAAPEDLVRYGPGVPAAPSGARVQLTAERAFRGGPPSSGHRRARVGLVLGSALAVILLAASGVLFYVRFHHPPLQVTRVAIVHSGRAAGCTVAVAGQISTNGTAGMITYQWLFPVGPPLTRHQSVRADQRSVNVQVTVEGSGNGVASQRVWLQVLHPGRRIASKDILVTCS